MTERPSEIIVLGMTNLTPHQDDCLETFGFFTAQSGQQLLCLPAPGAVTAVLAGFLAGGGIPTSLERGKPLPHDDVVVFLDPSLEKALDRRMPDWIVRPWVLVRPHQIDDFLSAYLAVLDQMGFDLEGMSTGVMGSG